MRTFVHPVLSSRNLRRGAWSCHTHTALCGGEAAAATASTAEAAKKLKKERTVSGCCKAADQRFVGSLAKVLVLHNTPKCQVGAVTSTCRAPPCSTLRAFHDTATCASAAVGLTPTMAAAVVKLIGPDMPTSGLHVSLETV